MGETDGTHVLLKGAGIGSGLVVARTAGRHLFSHTLAGVAGGALVVAATSPGFRRAARGLAVAALARGIVAGRSLGRFAEEARLQAEDLISEAQQAAGAPPAPSAGSHDDHAH